MRTRTFQDGRIKAREAWKGSTYTCMHTFVYTHTFMHTFVYAHKLWTGPLHSISRNVTSLCFSNSNQFGLQGQDSFMSVRDLISDVFRGSSFTPWFVWDPKGDATKKNGSQVLWPVAHGGPYRRCSLSKPLWPCWLSIQCLPSTPPSPASVPG